jgi:anti-sigma regulatory factor (Ser/Thr protein kinase)
VGPARKWAASVYADTGGDPAVCELLVSEVVTNAVQHASGDEVCVRVFPTGLIEVQDQSPYALPSRQKPDDDAESGRGLLLLEALAPGYLVTVGRHGKCVSFTPQGF